MNAKTGIPRLVMQDTYTTIKVDLSVDAGVFVKDVKERG
jgi:hypothetical protein